MSSTNNDQAPALGPLASPAAARPPGTHDTPQPEELDMPQPDFSSADLLDASWGDPPHRPAHLRAVDSLIEQLAPGDPDGVADWIKAHKAELNAAFNALAPRSMTHRRGRARDVVEVLADAGYLEDDGSVIVDRGTRRKVRTIVEELARLSFLDAADVCETYELLRARPLSWVSAAVSATRAKQKSRSGHPGPPVPAAVTAVIAAGTLRDRPDATFPDA